MSTETITIECNYCKWSGKIKAALEGKRGKCPNCAKVIELIPVSPLEPDLSLEEPEQSPSTSESLRDNPYAAPQSSASDTEHRPNQNDGELYLPERPENRDLLGRMFTSGMELFKQNWGILVLLTFLEILVGSIDDIVNGVVTFSGPTLPPAVIFSAAALSFFLSMYFSFAMAIGLCDAVKKQTKFTIPKVSRVLMKTLGMFVVGLIFGLFVAIIGGICATPAIMTGGNGWAIGGGIFIGMWPIGYIGLAANFSYMLYMDDRCSLFECIGKGFSLLKGNAWLFLFCLILLGIIAFAGILVLVIGGLFTMSWASAMYVCLYYILRDAYYDELDHVAWLTEKQFTP